VRLWTQSRENLDVVAVVFSNRACSGLQGDMRNVGVNDFGRNARHMLTLDEPALDWIATAKGMGMEAGHATVEEFAPLFGGALSSPGRFLIEAVLWR
jgi:acetolactate synthase-1/2/3 large subunit